MFYPETGRVFWLAFEGEDTVAGGGGNDTTAGGGGNDTVTGGGGDDVPTFDAKQQSYINGLLKRERETTAKKQAKEVETLLKGKNLSDKQRNELNQQLENLRSQYLTKEQQAQEQLERERKVSKETLGNTEKERDGWRMKYTTSTIKRAISDAAVMEDSYNPTQIEAILEPKTTLVEELDEEGKPTGELIPKVKFADTDKDGKRVILEIDPHEAVKKLRTMKEFENLFKTKAVGGIGSGPSGKGGGVMDVAKLAEDTVAYRKARKEGRIG